MPDVNLTGPVAGHPLDIATQEAQQQQAAEIAMAMIKGGLTPGGAVIHTGGNNPFARDIPNIAGPISQVFNAYMGAKGLEANQAAQMATARDYNERIGKAMPDLLNSLTPHDIELAGVPSDQGPMPPVHTQAIDPGEVWRAVGKAQTSQLGPVADFAKEIATAMLKSQSSQVLSGADMARILASGNVRTGSLPGAITPTALGPTLNPSALGTVDLTPKVEQTPGGGAVEINRNLPPGQAEARRVGSFPAPMPDVFPPNTNIPAGGTSRDVIPAKPGLPLAGASPAEVAAAGSTPATPAGSPNTSGATVTVSPTGEVKALETPQSKTTAAIQEQGAKDLTEGRDQAQTFQKMAPVLSQMVDLVDNARLGGITAAWITKAQQFAKSIGIADDVAGHIVDQQTLMKYATPQAFSMAHDLTSRPAVIEVLSALQSTAADPSVDPNTAKNVYRGFLVKGLNNLEIHNQNLEKYGNLPAFGKEQANLYSVNATPEQIFARSVDRSKNLYNFERDPSGIWRDAAIGTPQTRDQPKGKAGEPKHIRLEDYPEK